MSESGDSKTGQDVSFLQRWSRRKQEQARQSDTNQAVAEQEASEPVTEPATPQELPDVDSLHENSEVGMFFAEDVSEMLKRKALRKLFHLDKFNVCDGLDDYAEDYTLFEPLGEVMTAHQRLREERDSLNELVSRDVQDTPQNEQLPEDAQQLAEYDADSSTPEEAPVSDELPAEPEQKEG